MNKNPKSTNSNGRSKGGKRSKPDSLNIGRQRLGGYDPFMQRDRDFRCLHCRLQVSGDPHISGVRNRNHCPYCLYSQHVDFNEAGDRLAECKAEMKPVGLTLKQTRKKYGPNTGELMLVHICQGCGKISINRIAADDLTFKVLELVDGHTQLDVGTLNQIQENGIHMLQPADRSIVLRQLGGVAATSTGEG